jgi:hypothetical protein
MPTCRRTVWPKACWALLACPTQISRASSRTSIWSV